MKTLLIRSAAFGATFAIVFATICGAAYVWYTRPKTEPAWNAAALKATFSDVEAWYDLVDDNGNPIPGNPGGDVEFTYVVENRSGRDYSTDGSSVIAMVRRPDGLAASEGDIRVRYPIFIPAGQRVAVKIAVPYAHALGSIDAKTNVRERVRTNLPKFAGFVLFDRSTRYQIDCPRGW
jgi:hypothetical protein